MKKTLSLIMTFALILSFGAMAFAAPAGTQTIKINKTLPNVTELELYQVATYVYDEDDNNASKVDIVDAYVQDFVDTIAEAVADDSNLPALVADPSDTDIMLWITNNKATDKVFAAALAAKLNATAENQTAYATSGVVTDTSYTFTDVAAGYYLILDVTETAEYKYTNTLMLQPTTPNVVINLKSDYDKDIEKEIVDGDDSYAIGDVVDFKVTATVPNKGDSTFTYVVTDTMSAGLTLVADSVKVNGVAIEDTTVGYAVDGQKQTFTFTETNSNAGDKFVITYSATLNANAANSENNVVFETYGDDKYEGETVNIYTFDLKVEKVNEADEALAGVTFALKNEAGEYLTFDAAGKYTGVAADADAKTILTTDINGEIALHGLDEGTYLLEEIATLPGYNKLTSDVTVTIARGTDNDGNIVFLTTQEVVNTTGILLPGTGGEGVAVITLLGTVMMLSAAAFLVLNKKRLFN